MQNRSTGIATVLKDDLLERVLLIRTLDERLAPRRHPAIRSLFLRL